MPKDQHLDDQEEQYRNDRNMAICRNAAILIVNEKFSRLDALEKAQDIFIAQEEADADVTGAKGTLAEAQSPTVKLGTEAQVAAITQELFESLN
jgi:hypothetical protein